MVEIGLDTGCAERPAREAAPAHRGHTNTDTKTQTPNSLKDEGESNELMG